MGGNNLASSDLFSKSPLAYCIAGWSNIMEVLQVHLLGAIVVEEDSGSSDRILKDFLGVPTKNPDYHPLL